MASKLRTRIKSPPKVQFSLPTKLEANSYSQNKVAKQTVSSSSPQNQIASLLLKEDRSTLRKKLQLGNYLDRVGATGARGLVVSRESLPKGINSYNSPETGSPSERSRQDLDPLPVIKAKSSDDTKLSRKIVGKENINSDRDRTAKSSDPELASSQSSVVSTENTKVRGFFGRFKKFFASLVRKVKKTVRSIGKKLTKIPKNLFHFPGSDPDAIIRLAKSRSRSLSRLGKIKARQIIRKAKQRAKAISRHARKRGRRIAWLARRRARLLVLRRKRKAEQTVQQAKLKAEQINTDSKSRAQRLMHNGEYTAARKLLHDSRKRSRLMVRQADLRAKRIVAPAESLAQKIIELGEAKANRIIKQGRIRASITVKRGEKTAKQTAQRYQRLSKQVLERGKQRAKQEADKRERNRPWWEKIGAWFSNLFKKIGNFVGNALKSIGRFLGNVVRAVVRGVTNFVKGVVNAVVTAVKFIAKQARKLIDAAKKILKKIGEVVVAVAKAAFEVVKKIGQIIVDVITGPFKILATLIQILKGIGGKVLSVIGDIFSNPLKFGATLIEGFQLGFNNFASKFTQHLENFFLQGLAAKEALDNTTIGDIKTYLVETIIQGAIPFAMAKLVASSIPIIGWIMAAIDGLEMANEIFIKRAKEVVTLVESFGNSIVEAAKHQKAAVANAVEMGMATGIVVLISALAAYAKLGNIRQKIQKIIGGKSRKKGKKGKKGKDKDDRQNAKQDKKEEEKAEKQKPEKRKKAAINALKRVMKARKSMTEEELTKVFKKLEKKHKVNIRLNSKRSKPNVAISASPATFLPLAILGMRSGQKQGAQNVKSVQAGDYIKAIRYDGPHNTPGHEVVQQFEARFKGKPTLYNNNTPPQKVKTAAGHVTVYTTGSINPAALLNNGMKTAQNPNGYWRAGIVTAQSSKERGRGRSNKTGKETVFGHFGADEEKIRTGKLNTIYNGGHLVGDQIMDSKTAFNLYEDWNLVPQQRSFNTPIYTGTIENPVTRAIRAGKGKTKIQYEVKVQYPDSTYNVKPSDLIQNLLPATDTYRKEIEKAINYNNTLDADFTFTRRTPGFWQATAKIIAGKETLNSGKVRKRQDVAFANPAKVQAGVNYQPMGQEQVRYTLESDLKPPIAGPTPKQPMKYTGAKLILVTARQETF